MMQPVRFEQRWNADEWLRLLTEMGVAHLTAVQWAEAFRSEIQPARFSAGMDDLRGFTTTFLHETAMLKRMQEDLCYSAARIVQVWPSRFKNELAALPYAGSVSGRNPDMAAAQRLANNVYANRMGNGDASSGDGWNYRGRAAGITGRRNYLWLADKWGQDLETNPSLLEMPHYALEGSFHVWEGLVPDRDLSDQVQVRRDYNGGLIGMEHCRDLYALCSKVTA